MPEFATWCLTMKKKAGILSQLKSLHQRATGTLTLLEHTMTTKTKAACKLAMKYDAEQMYGKYPYTHHLEEVAKYTKEIHRKGLFGSKDLDKDLLLAVAYCHDIYEDTQVSLIELEEAIGYAGLETVLMLSKNWCPCSYELYIKSIKLWCISRIVKIADTWANLENSWKAGEVKRIAKYTKQLNMLLED